MMPGPVRRASTPGTEEDPISSEPERVPPDVDPGRANAARMYDYLLGGSHNFRADQDLARQIAAVEPNVRLMARANRMFLGRAVRYLAGTGISQFLDIGSGIPTQGNVHEAAGPAARVVYADVDPVAVAYSRAILAGSGSAAVIRADLRDPAAIVAHDTTRQLIDFTRPAGLLLVAVLHFIPDADDPWRLVAALRDALAPGSCLVLCHATAEGRPGTARAMETVYNRSAVTSGHIRTRPEIERFFDGFELLSPGLVRVPEWRPDPGTDPGDRDKLWSLLAGVGRKPHQA
jgi:SAM-dependent methyltransferase